MTTYIHAALHRLQLRSKKKKRKYFERKKEIRNLKVGRGRGKELLDSHIASN